MVPNAFVETMIEWISSEDSDIYYRAIRYFDKITVLTPEAQNQVLQVLSLFLGVITRT